jgi:hypothetical protein
VVAASRSRRLASSEIATTSTRGVMTSRTTVSSRSITPLIISCSEASITPDSSAERSIMRSSFSVISGSLLGSRRKARRTIVVNHANARPTG